MVLLFLPICNFSKVHLLANHLGCLPCSSQTLPSLISTYTHTHTRGSPPTYVQFSHSVVSDSLQPHELQHARPPCPSQSPGVCSNSCPSSRWCHPAISSSVFPFSSCPQFLPSMLTLCNYHFPCYSCWDWTVDILPVDREAEKSNEFVRESQKKMPQRATLIGNGEAESFLGHCSSPFLRPGRVVWLPWSL